MRKLELFADVEFRIAKQVKLKQRLSVAAACNLLVKDKEKEWKNIPGVSAGVLRERYYEAKRLLDFKNNPWAANLVRIIRGVKKPVAK